MIQNPPEAYNVKEAAIKLQMLLPFSQIMHVRESEENPAVLEMIYYHNCVMPHIYLRSTEIFHECRCRCPTLLDYTSRKCGKIRGTTTQRHFHRARNIVVKVGSRVSGLFITYPNREGCLQPV